MDNPIKEMVENSHPVHRRYVGYWDFLLQSYEGGVDYSNSLIANQNQPGNFLDSLVRIFVNGQQQGTQTIQGNLFMHPKERFDDYNRRVRMSYYYNFCAPIIDIYGDHLFKQAVNEDWKEIEETIKIVGPDIDRKGSTIQEFRKSVSDMAQLYGHCFVVVDSPDNSKTESVVTRADQIANKAFPYLTLYSPQNVLNWALDEYGFPYWVLLREVYDGSPDPTSFKKDEKKKCAYRLWTREAWFLYDDDYVLQNKGTHDLGEVPITCVYDKKSNKQRGFLGISTIADIAFIARDIYNASSELRQILRDQTFAFLAINGSSDEYADLDLGTGKGLLYPEGRDAPQYVSPPSDNATIYFDHIDRQIVKIYQIAKIDAGVSGQTKATPASTGTVDNQSGVSKAWSFNQTNSSLSTKSGNMEDAEIRWWTLFAKWEGKTFTGSIQYPNEFSISALSDDLDEAEQESRLMMGKTFNTEIRKSIIKKKFPRKSDQDIAIMEKEVEDLQGQLEKQSQQPVNSLAQRFMAGRNNTTGTTGFNNQGGANG